MVLISEDGRYVSAWDGRVHDDGGVTFWTDDWIWDTFHALHPLQILLNPGVHGEKHASYVRACEQSDWMPTFPTVFRDARCVHGQHAVALLADAWRKGIRGCDLERAYACMRTTMRETRGSTHGVRLGELTSRIFSDAVDAHPSPDTAASDAVDGVRNAAVGSSSLLPSTRQFPNRIKRSQRTPGQAVGHHNPGSDLG